MRCLVSKKVFFAFFFFYLVITLILLVFTPITHKEAAFLYLQKASITTFLVQKIYALTHSLVTIRLLFFLASLFSLFFFIKLAKKFLDKEEFVYLSALIFLLIPGVFVSFIIANYASYAMLFTLSVLFFIEKEKFFLASLFLMLLFFSSTAQFALYVAFFFYGYFRKKYLFAVFNFVLLIVSLYFERYEIGGVPKGHLVDLFAIYGVIFSPFYLLALIYALYRYLIKESKNSIWYVSFSAFFFSLLLSIRQKIAVTDFSVYLVPATILVVSTLKKSMEIRLPQFRTIYVRVCQVVVFFLFLETLLIALHYPILHLSKGKIIIIDSSIYKIAQLAKEKKCIIDFQRRHIHLYRFYHLQKCR